MKKRELFFDIATTLNFIMILTLIWGGYIEVGLWEGIAMAAMSGFITCFYTFMMYGRVLEIINKRTGENDDESKIKI